MNRGRPTNTGPSSGFRGGSSNRGRGGCRRHSPVGADTPFGRGRGNCVYRPKNPVSVSVSVSDAQHGFSNSGKLEQVQHPPQAPDTAPNQSECFVTPDIVHHTVLSSMLTHSTSTETLQIGQTQIEGAEVKDVSQLPSGSCTQHPPSQEQGPNKIQGIKDSGQSQIIPFDICLPKTGTTVMLKPSLLVTNREKRRSIEEQNERMLRPGMILLKNYLSISDQVKIVRECRDLGLGPGGFYQPGYRDGAKLHLKMMCLGKNWDPETSKYGDFRPIDGAKPSNIPQEFYQFVENAIKDSHALIERNSKRSDVKNILPWMSPSICIVNFYSASGKLGLHQDKDESEESLHNGLPVVSFSLGDTAEFLYGDQRDVGMAEKVELKSGDVLIFGGKSRLIFHGVSAIRPNTAPMALLKETNLCPGRLNLTFRQY